MPDSDTLTFSQGTKVKNFTLTIKIDEADDPPSRRDLPEQLASLGFVRFKTSKKVIDRNMLESTQSFVLCAPTNLPCPWVYFQRLWLCGMKFMENWRYAGCE